MCKFHQDVALDVAQNMDGSFHPLSFNMNALALGVNFDIDTYTPTMSGISGYNIYALAGKKGRDALASSGLTYDPYAFQAYRHDTIGFLRQRSADIIAKHKISDHVLKKIGRGNQAIHFLNAIPDHVYASFDNSSADIYKNDKEKNLYHGLRLAAADYWDDTDTQEILQKYFEFSVAKIFTQAQKKAHPLVLRGYESLPDVVKQYGDCAKGICTGAGIGVVAHIGCIAKFGLLPLIGASTALTSNPVLTFGVMTGLSAGGIGLWQRIHKKRGSVPNRLEKFATYGATLAAFGLAVAAHSDHIITDQHKNTAQATYYTDESGQQFMIREAVICSGFETRIMRDTIAIGGQPSGLLSP